MTKEEVIIEKSIELRRKLSAVIMEFWKNNAELSQKDTFYINSVTVASLMAQTAYLMFKKDNRIPPKDYIKSICDFSLEQFEELNNLKSMEIH